MIPALENIDFTQFSVDDRLALIGRIWDRFDDAPASLSPEQTSELDRRDADEDRRRDVGVTWAELKQRVQGLP